MSGSRHTKGPWGWGRFPNQDGVPAQTVEEVIECMAYSARQSELGELWGVMGGTPDDPVVVCYTGNGPTSEANARFIRAAPDLLEALISVRNTLIDATADGDCNLPGLLEYVTAVVARAEGREP